MRALQVGDIVKRIDERPFTKGQRTARVTGIALGTRVATHDAPTVFRWPASELVIVYSEAENRDGAARARR